MTDQNIRNLGDGLILRHSSGEDAKAITAFNKEIHGEGEWDAKGLEDWSLDLMSGESPAFSVNDFTVVEDTNTGEIVSVCCLISQTWAYEGIPFGVGRPELVGTKKEYRRRGLVREQFTVLHQWSAERGELAQAITGIPYYYRQFGYEMALNLSGGRAGYEIHVPELEKDEEEPFTFRPASEEDIPFLMSCYEIGCKRSLIHAVWDEALWRYEITSKRKYNINRREIYIIEDTQGSRAGFFGIPPVKWGRMSTLTIFELAPGYAWKDVIPGVIRFLWQKGEELAKEQDQKQQMFGFWLGESHPVYEVATTKLPRVQKPYSYYMRVPDLPAFITTITPVLEKRLNESSFAHYSGEIKLNLYRDGLAFSFNAGQLQHITPLTFDELAKCDAAFPPLVFLHLLFGHRSMAELRYAFTDCSAKDDETTHLLDALFPKRPSDIWPVS